MQPSSLAWKACLEKKSQIADYLLILSGKECLAVGSFTNIQPHSYVHIKTTQDYFSNSNILFSSINVGVDACPVGSHNQLNIFGQKYSISTSIFSLLYFYFFHVQYSYQFIKANNFCNFFMSMGVCIIDLNFLVQIPH